MVSPSLYHNPFVPCTLKPNEYGLGRLVSCVTITVSPLAHLIIVVTTSPRLKLMPAYGWSLPPLSIMNLCRPFALDDMDDKVKNRFPRLISRQQATGPMP